MFTMVQAVQVKGTASAFRIPSQTRLCSSMTPPPYPGSTSSRYNGRKRKFEYGKVNTRNSTPVEGLPISVSRYKETSFQFSSDQPLESGEYAILFADKIYTFGVDDKK